MSTQFKLTTLTNGVLEGHVRQDRKNRRAVIFVHGFGGDMNTTWQPKEGGQYFFDLLKDDAELADFDYLTFGFKSGPLGGASASNVAVQLKNQIETHLADRQIVLVAHSLGGIVCMRYILDELIAGRTLKTVGLVMYGTPTNGTELVNAAKALSVGLAIATAGFWDVLAKLGGFLIRRNKQLQELAAHSEFLQQVHDQWIYRVANGGNSAEQDTTRRAFLNVRMVTGNDDWVVNEHSAKGIYGEIDWHPLTYGHIALVKPEDRTDARYLALKSFLLNGLPGMSPNRLARVRHFAESIWKARQSPAIGKWTFTAELNLDTDTDDPALKAAGFSTSTYYCKYRMPLTCLSIPVGLSCGDAGGKAIWGTTPEPRYVHLMRLDLLPADQRGRLTKAVTDKLSLGSPESRWDAFFPHVSVTINGIETIPGKILPDHAGPNVGWLLRYFELPEAHRNLIGQDVELVLSYRSIIPRELTSFRVYYPWLVDGCECTVKVNANLQTFVPVYDFPKGQQFNATQEPENPEFRSLTVISNDLILPDSAFWVFWDRQQSK